MDVKRNGVYHTRPQTWNLDCAKASGFDDRNRVHISNIDPVTIVESRELSRGPKSKFVTKCGINLSYDKIGKGKLTFIFLHGLGINRTFFAPQVEHFGKMGQILNIDLRGHGQSDKPKEGYTIAEYAEDVAAICKHEKVSKAIVIGHSISGCIALELNSRYPEFLSAMVLLDTSLFPPEPAYAFIYGLIDAIKKDYAKTLEGIAEERCYPEHRPLVKKSFLETPDYVWCSSFESMLDWNKKSAEQCIRKCTIPIAYIEGPKLMVDVSRFQTYSSIEMVRGKVICSGHFVTIEVPEQINPMIDRFISVCVKKNDR